MVQFFFFLSVFLSCGLCCAFEAVEIENLVIEPFGEADSTRVNLRIERFDVIDSTQREARRRYAELKQEEWRAFYAEEQTAGIGQGIRTWSSPSKVNIYVTFMVPFPNDPFLTNPFLFMNIPKVTAVSVCQTIECFGLESGLKWPTDIMIKDKKVAGVLCEGIPLGGRDFFNCLIGIGLNVNMEPEICGSFDQPVTSMSLEAGHEFDDREKIFTILTQRLVSNLMNFFREKTFAPFLPFIGERLLHIDKEVLVVDRKEPFLPDDEHHPLTKKGVVRRIDENGRLLLETSPNFLETCTAGRIKPLS